MLKTAVHSSLHTISLKHQKDSYALSALYGIYGTGGSFEVWLQQDITTARVANLKTEKCCFVIILSLSSSSSVKPSTITEALLTDILHVALL